MWCISLFNGLFNYGVTKAGGYSFGFCLHLFWTNLGRNEQENFFHSVARCYSNILVAQNRISTVLFFQLKFFPHVLTTNPSSVPNNKCMFVCAYNHHGIINPIQGRGSKKASLPCQFFLCNFSKSMHYP